MQNIFQNKRTLIISVFIVVIIAIVGSFIIFRNQGQEIEAADWFDEDYYYRQSSALTNSSSTAVTNQFVKVTLDSATLISAGKMQSDCDDLRITNSAGEILPHFIDGDTDYDCNDSDTSVWVMADSIPTSGSTIYLYYGNPSAENGETSIGTPDHPAPSCRSIMEHDSTKGTGQYYISPSGNKADQFQVTCEMDTDEGGWVKVYEGLCTSATAVTRTEGNIVEISNSIPFDNMRIKAKNWYLDETSTTTETAFFDQTFSWYFEWLHTEPDSPAPDVAFHDADGNQDVEFTVSGGMMSGYGNSWRHVIDSEFNTQPHDSYMYTAGLQAHGIEAVEWDADHYNAQMNNTTPLESGMGLSPRAAQEIFVWLREDNITLNQTDQSAGAPASEEQGPGPLAHWKLDEGYGTTAYDSSPNNYDGTITNAVWKDESECISGKCMYFDGSGDYIATGFGSGRNLADNPMTISMWVRPIDKGSDYMFIAADTGTNQRFYIANYNDTWDMGIQSSAWSGINGGSIEYGKWHHLEIVADGSAVKMYVNGDYKFQKTYTSYALYSDLSIAYYGTGSSYAGNTYVDDVKIYDYARSAAQIKEDYNRGQAVYFGSQADQGLSKGLMAHWKMDESAANSCSGGEDTCDSTGNGNHGTWYADATVTSTAKYGRAVYFDGTLDRIDVTSSPEINSTTNGTFSISLWVRPDTFSTAWFRGLIVQENYLNSGFRFGFNSSGEPTFWTAQSGGTLQTTFQSSKGMTLNKWNHIVVTYDNQQAYMYLNGERTADARGTYVAGSNIFRLGQAVSETFSGMMDEVRYYNRALSYDDVRRLYEWSPGPIAHWKFQEATGTTAYDSSGNENNGTLGTDGAGDDVPDWTQGKYGKGLKFVEDDIRFTDNDNLDTGDQFTFMGWYLYDDLTFRSDLYFYNRNAQSGSNGFHIIWNNRSGNTIGYQYGNGSSVVSKYSDALTWETGRWYHIAVSHDNNAKEINYYRNGINVGTQTYTDNALNVTSGHAYVGGYQGDHRFKGKIDDVRLYDYILSPRQILEAMNAGKKNNPVAYWSFDEGEGTTAYDRGITSTSTTGTSGHDGILTDMSTSGTSTDWVGGKVGNALELDGVNDYIDIPDNILATSSEFSISGWIRPNGENNTESYNQQTVLDLRGEYSVFINWMETDDSTSKESIQFYIYNGTTSERVYSDDYSVPINNWTHFAATYKNNSMKLYINGELNNTGTSGHPTTYVGNSKIGKDYAATDRLWFNGGIDELKIYSYELTMDEIRQNYNAGDQITLTKSQEEVQQVSEGLVGWWKMDEDSWSGTAGEVRDYSGNENHGTGIGTDKNSTTTARFGRAGEFNGTDDYVSVADSSSLDLIKGATLQAWIYKTANPTSNAKGIIEKASAYGLRINPNGTLGTAFNTVEGGWNSSGNSNTAIGNNNWNHVALTYDGNDGRVKLYLNGQLDGESTNNIGGNLVPNSNILTIARETNSRYFDGLVDDAKVYNYVRSAEQIMSDFADGPPPVGFWSLDQITSRDESGMGNNMMNGADVPVVKNAVSCKIGNCLEFDGEDDAIRTGSDPDVLDIQGPLSISAWIYPTGDDTNQSEIVRKHNAYHFAVKNNDIVTLVYGLTDTTLNTSTDAVPYNQWSYAVFTYDGATKSIYVNGELITSEAATGSISDVSSYVSIGHAIEFDGYYFIGKIDDVKIFDYALTPRQIAQEYNEGKPIGYWKFDKGEGPTADDSSGNGNNGTVYPGTGGTNTATSSMWSNGVTGKLNGSMDFDDTDDYVSIADNSLLDNLTSASVSAWFKWNGSGSTIDFITSKYGSSEYLEIHLGGGGGSNGIRAIIGNGSGCYTDSGDNAFTPGDWVHVVAVQDEVSSQTTLYIDGEKKAVSDGTCTSDINNSNALTIGRRSSGTSYDFNGQIDEVKIWNYPLTPEEVKEDYNLGFGTFFR